jgi:hypothetical protein
VRDKGEVEEARYDSDLISDSYNRSAAGLILKGTLGPCELHEGSDIESALLSWQMKRLKILPAERYLCAHQRAEQDSSSTSPRTRY